MDVDVKCKTKLLIVYQLIYSCVFINLHAQIDDIDIVEMIKI